MIEVHIYIVRSFPGEANEEGRRGGQVWNAVRFFLEKDGKED